jgi:thiamine biosynthesis lipoprotein
MTAVTAAATARDTFRVFGTTATLLVTEARVLAAARQLADAELAAVDLACSRFRADSELSMLNAAAGQTVDVSGLFAELLSEALRAARLTDGAVDPTCGRALADLGYDRDFTQVRAAGSGSCGTMPASTAAASTAEHGDPLPGRVGAGQEALVRQRLPGREVGGTGAAGISRADTVHAGTVPAGTVSAGSGRRVSPVPGWRQVLLQENPPRARLAGGAQLDLGATAKAWAADRCAEIITGRLGCGVLVSLGGDIAVAGPVPAGGWRIRVTDDHAAGPDAPGQTVAISSGGLATSSTTVRAWTRDGRRMHHIVDPATGEPARSCWRTVSVAAGSCTDANIASTAAIVRGPAAVGWLRELGLPARLVRADGSAETTAGWPGGPGPGPEPVPAPATGT